MTDIGLPGVNGLEAAREILRRNPDARVVFVTVDSSPEVVQRGFDMGALGYVLKLAAGDDLVPAVHSALRGNRYVSELHGSSHSFHSRTSIMTPMNTAWNAFGAAGQQRAEAETLAILDRLAGELSSALIRLDGDQMLAAVENTERQIVEALDIDRCGLSTYPDGGDAPKELRAWTRPGVRAVTIEDQQQVPWYMGCQVRCETVVLHRVPDDLPLEAASDVAVRQAGAAEVAPRHPGRHRRAARLRAHGLVLSRLSHLDRSGRSAHATPRGSHGLGVVARSAGGVAA